MYLTSFSFVFFLFSRSTEFSRHYACSEVPESWISSKRFLYSTDLYFLVMFSVWDTVDTRPTNMKLLNLPPLVDRSSRPMKLHSLTWLRSRFFMRVMLYSSCCGCFCRLQNVSGSSIVLFVVCFVISPTTDLIVECLYLEAQWVRVKFYYVYTYSLKSI